MTRAELLSMAREAGLLSDNPRTPGTHDMVARRLLAFAALVAAAEREACETAVAEAQYSGGEEAFIEIACDAIRARGGGEVSDATVEALAMIAIALIVILAFFGSDIND